MRTLFLLLVLSLAFGSEVQAFGFETLSLPAADTYYVNYSMPGKDVGFNEWHIHYPCVYDTANGGVWVSGFVYSNVKDSITSGFANRHAAKPGSGYYNSNQYVVAYGQLNYIKSLQRLGNLGYLYITNTTYAYNSMRDGDSLAKKFGGLSGHDPDWFKLTLTSYQNGDTMPNGSLDFYLADFRFADSSKDYIVKDWTRIDRPFGVSDSITFSLSSSDTGRFGINTPLYFCLDLVFFGWEGVQTIPFAQAATFAPNPAGDFIQLTLKDASMKEATISDISGRQLGSFSLREPLITIGIAALPPGSYVLKLSGSKGSTATIFTRR